MADVHEARVEAAARALRDDKANRVDTYAVPEWEDTGYGDKLVYLGQARAALAAADAVVTVEEIRDEIAGHPIGSGYYQTTVGVDEAREIAENIQRLYRGAPQ